MFSKKRELPFMRKVLVVLIMLFTIAGCSSTGGSTTASDSRAPAVLDIVATTGMIADIVQNVGGQHVQVQAMMGPGVDPHLYVASEGDVEALQNADIIFYNGLFLE